MSGGTRVSLAGALLEPGFVWRNGIRTERGGARVRSFDVDGRRRPSLSAASSEHFAVPRLHPRLDEVNTYLGWFGRASRPLQALSVLGAGVRHVPGISRAMRALPRGATGGPDSETRARTRWHVTAIAYDDRGAELAQVQLSAGNGYDFTASILAWGAAHARSGVDGVGALGPVEAFGLSQLEAGCAEAGLHA